jgi:hypothetical protein
MTLRYGPTSVGSARDSNLAPGSLHGWRRGFSFAALPPTKNEHDRSGLYALWQVPARRFNDASGRLGLCQGGAIMRAAHADYKADSAIVEPGHRRSGRIGCRWPPRRANSPPLCGASGR